MLRLGAKIALKGKIPEKDLELDGEAHKDTISQDMDQSQWDSYLEKLKKHHEDKSLEDFLTTEIQAVSSMDEEESKKCMTLLYAAELEIHGEKAEVHRCLKENVGGQFVKRNLQYNGGSSWSTSSPMFSRISTWRSWHSPDDPSRHILTIRFLN